jgi:hypothetical protein
VKLDKHLTDFADYRSVQTKHTRRFSLLSSCFFMAASGLAIAATDPVEDLKNCARMADKVERVACYEALGQRVLGEEASAATRDDQKLVGTQSEVSEPPPARSAAKDLVVTEAAVSEVASVDPAVAEAAAVTVATSPPETDRMPEDLGKDDKKETKERKSAEKKTYRGHVQSCGQMSDNKWYFVFDNGQVWKQSSNGSYRFKQCDFDVTISKDFFSYKMKIDGGKTLRVRRER